MKILVVQNCELEGLGLYRDCLRERSVDLQVCRAFDGESLPPVESFDALVVGGTPLPAYEAERHPVLAAELDYLARAAATGRPVLGVCCGGQLLARALGGAARRNARMEIGGYDVRLTDAGRGDPLLNGFPDVFPVFHWHGDTFDPPPGADLLVEGDDCKEQLFRRDRAVGVIFHLEITARAAARWAAAYAGELPRVGKTADEVVAECAHAEPQMRALAERLVQNFLAL